MHPKPFIFCPLCGGPTEQLIPEGDNRERPVCTLCKEIHYVNPTTVVGAVVTWEDQFLLCVRAIAPRKGFWTVPAGFLEQRESCEEGAQRETMEEANATICIDRLLGVYNIVHISQTQLLYLAHLEKPEFSAGPESLEVALFEYDDIPWDDLAFPTVRWALRHAKKMMDDPSLRVQRRSTEPPPWYKEP